MSERFMPGPAGTSDPNEERTSGEWMLAGSIDGGATERETLEPGAAWLAGSRFLCRHGVPLWGSCWRCQRQMPRPVVAGSIEDVSWEDAA